jgi:hypothetical protein
MDIILLIVLLLVILVGVFIVLPQVMERMALRQLIATFRGQRATVSSRSLTLEQLGIGKRRGSLSGMLLGKRDPKRKALLMLIETKL